MTQALESTSDAFPGFSLVYAEVQRALFDDVRPEWERYCAGRPEAVEP